MYLKRFIVGLVTIFLLVLSVGPASAAVPEQEIVVPVETLGVGEYDVCWLPTSPKLLCWAASSLSYLEDESPARSFKQISVGSEYKCAVIKDGSIKCWGDNTSGQADAPAGIFSQVSASFYHTCAVRRDGIALCWGRNGNGQSTPPTGKFKYVDAGRFHTCGVHVDGTLACWGWNEHDLSMPPTGTFVQVSAGRSHNCAVRTDGTVACWGRNTYNEATSPPGTFIQVSVGSFHSCGLRTDGIVTCWGSNNNGQTDVPAGTFVQIGSTAKGACALPAGGTPICWGAVNNPFYTSIAADDGWVLESSENSNTGATIDNVSSNLVLGDDAADRQYRVVLSFNTSNLPDNAVPKTAILMLKQNGKPVGSDPFKVLGRLKTDIRGGRLGDASTLDSDDFNAAASADVGVFEGGPIEGWYSITFSQAGLSRIYIDGKTQLRLYFAVDDNNNNIADYIRFLSGDSAKDKPWMFISYTYH